MKLDVALHLLGHPIESLIELVVGIHAVDGDLALGVIHVRPPVLGAHLRFVVTLTFLPISSLPCSSNPLLVDSEGGMCVFVPLGPLDVEDDVAAVAFVAVPVVATGAVSIASSGIVVWGCRRPPRPRPASTCQREGSSPVGTARRVLSSFSRTFSKNAFSQCRAGTTEFALNPHPAILRVSLALAGQHGSASGTCRCKS